MAEDTSYQVTITKNIMKKAFTFIELTKEYPMEDAHKLILLITGTVSPLVLTIMFVLLVVLTLIIVNRRRVKKK